MTIIDNVANSNPAKPYNRYLARRAVFSRLLALTYVALLFNIHRHLLLLLGLNFYYVSVSSFFDRVSSFRYRYTLHRIYDIFESKIMYLY